MDRKSQCFSHLRENEDVAITLIKLNELRENYLRAGKAIFTANTSLSNEPSFSISPIANRPINRATLIPLTPERARGPTYLRVKNRRTASLPGVRWREWLARLLKNREVNYLHSSMPKWCPEWKRKRDKYRGEDRFHRFSHEREWFSAW